MGSVAIFWMQLLVSCVVFTVVAVWCVWPTLANLRRNSALIPLLWMHVSYYVGTALLVTRWLARNCPTSSFPVRLTAICWKRRWLSSPSSLCGATRVAPFFS
jgi:hypothetical protein